MTPRGNGLRASAYAVLAEVDELTGARLLDALAERQIAAYVVPAPGLNGTTRLILHVDAARRVPARVVLAGLSPARAAEPNADLGESSGEPRESAPPAGAAPKHDPAAVDEAFSQLIATFHDAPAVRSWPDAEDLPPSATGSPPSHDPTPGGEPRNLFDPWQRRSQQPWDPAADPDRRRRAPGARPPADPEPGARPPRPGAHRPLPPPGFVGRPSRDVTPQSPHGPAAQSPRGPAAPSPRGPGAQSRGDDSVDDDHYVPPPLPKLRPTAPATRWAFTAMAFGLALLLVPTLLTLEHTTTTDIAGVACILGATAYLLTRLRPDSASSPDDPDDGAVV